MKRILLVLLIFAVAGGLFAQVEFGGSAGTGVMVAAEDGETTVHLSRNGGGTQYYWEIWGAWEAESGRSGVDIGFDAYTDEIAGWGAGVWYKPLDILTLYAGANGAPGYGTPGSLGTSNAGYINETAGLAIRLVPMTGLAIGAGFAPSGAEFGDASYGVGVSYTASGVISLAANLGYNGETEVTNVAAGLDYLGLAGLGITKLAVDVRADNISDLAWIGIGPRVNFSVAGISGHVRSNIYLPMTDDGNMNFVAGAQGSYTVVPGVTASLGVGYGANGAVANTAGSNFDYRYWDSIPNKGLNKADTSFLGIHPAISWNVFGGATIGAGYSLLTQLGGDSYMKHAVYANFNVSF
jgi:hypothetical protein